MSAQKIECWFLGMIILTFTYDICVRKITEGCEFSENKNFLIGVVRVTNGYRLILNIVLLEPVIEIVPWQRHRFIDTKGITIKATSLFD